MNASSRSSSRIEAAFPVHQRALVLVLVGHHQRRNTVFCGHPEVIGTKGGCNVHNAGTVFGGHKITGQHPEGALARDSPS